MRPTVSVLLCLLLAESGLAQSLEAMAGTKRLFIDAQYFEPFHEKSKFSLFSRSRATASYLSVSSFKFII